jgi:hypothetical protein
MYSRRSQNSPVPPSATRYHSKEEALQTSGDFHAGRFEYERVIDEICRLPWKTLLIDDLTDVARAYYYFSVQFRENLEIACQLYPDDSKIRQLKQEECNTDNLSPWPAVASDGEKVNHDEFVRRLLLLAPVNDMKQRRLDEIGQSYLDKVHKMDCITRASSIAAYEGGGLERVFRAILESQHWNSPLLLAFKHFLIQHIKFDNNPLQGHGALIGQLMVDDEILPLWIAFKVLLVEVVPKLSA